MRERYSELSPRLVPGEHFMEWHNRPRFREMSFSEDSISHRDFFTRHGYNVGEFVDNMFKPAMTSLSEKDFSLGLTKVSAYSCDECLAWAYAVLYPVYHVSNNDAIGFGMRSRSVRHARRRFTKTIYNRSSPKERQ